MSEAVLASAEPATGWQARLDLAFAPVAGRTALVRRQHQGPLLVQRAFHPEGPVCHLYVVHPPGGVVGGDRLALDAEALPGAEVLLTTPAAGKFYRSGGRLARQTVSLALEQAALEWLPQETIFYPGAEVRQRTVVRLGEGARFIGWEIGCLGLAARGEPYDRGQVTQGFELWRGEQPLLLDRLRLDGGAAALQARWGLAGFTVAATFAAYPASAADLEAVRAAGEDGLDGRAGLSLVDGVLVGRVLARHADAARRQLVSWWSALRPRLLGRLALAPRIWAT